MAGVWDYIEVPVCVLLGLLYIRWYGRRCYNRGLMVSRHTLDTQIKNTLIVAEHSIRHYRKTLLEATGIDHEWQMRFDEKNCPHIRQVSTFKPEKIKVNLN